METFIDASWQILLELAPWLLLGAAIGGVLHVLLPARFLRQQLSGRSGVLKAVALGVPLPLCSCGVIPVGMQLKKSGASTGAVVAFLTSTPQTGADSILVSASMLGWPLAIFKVISAAVTGLVGGWLTDSLTSEPSPALPVIDPTSAEAKRGYGEIVSHAVELVRSIWGWLVIGVLVSAALTTLLPETALVGLDSYGGLAAMLATLLISVPLYVCATASVPIAAALVVGGLPTGAAIVFLMAGPATNAATLGAVYRTLGRRPLVIYLTTIVVGSVVCGWAFDSILSSETVRPSDKHEMTQWWSVVSACVLLLLIGWFSLKDLARARRKFFPAPKSAAPTVQVKVSGMTCANCVAKLEDSLVADRQIESACVSLEPGEAIVQGTASESHIRTLIEQAGFHPE